MILAELKPAPEVQRLLAPYPRVLAVQCGACSQVEHAEGEAGARDFVARLVREGLRGISLGEIFDHPCQGTKLKRIEERAAEFGAILMLGCSLGTQALAERFPDKPVIAAVNMKLREAEELPSDWAERCLACGDCRLGNLGGVCPLTRCAKGLVNGPCGGAVDEGCEADPASIPCAWEKIAQRLERQGRLAELRAIAAPRDWFHPPAGTGKPLLWEDFEQEATEKTEDRPPEDKGKQEGLQEQ